MILIDNQILELLEKPRSLEDNQAGVTLQNNHKLHITGEGYLKKVKKVQGYESANDFSIREQIAQPSTIQITSIILDNLNRWLTAQGTVKRVDFKDDKKNKDFQAVLDQVWQGKSFDHFIRTFYKDGIYTEFNGFALVTKPKRIDSNYIDREGIIQRSNGESLNPYLIFISASEVHDYFLSGDKVEYLIIKLDKDGKQFRIIDDAKDVIINYDKSKKRYAIEGEEVINTLGYVPARKLTTLNKYLLNNQVKTSPIDHIIPALDRYFSSDADLRMQFIKHNYPKLAIVMTECNRCDGTGDYLNDKDEKVSCPTCMGSGKVIPIGRDGVIGLPQYLESGETAFPGAPATYITPDTESLRLGLEDLEKQRLDILYSGTGDKNLIIEGLNTATENLINSRSLEDRIAEISMMVEEVEKFLKKAIKEMHNDFAAITEYSITVNYGRRISVKGEAELSDEIRRAKENAMPMSYVQALQKDLIYAKYKNNDREMQRQVMLLDIEPFAGYSIKELKEIEERLNADDFDLKANFDSVLDQWESQNILIEYKANLPYKQRVNAIKEELNVLLSERRANGGGSPV